MAYWITEACIGCTACVRICPVQAITGERNQQHHIIAEVCIDCGACSRVCPVDAIEDSQRAPTFHIKRSLWPKPVIDPAQCVCCGVCIQACPVGCLGLGNTLKNDGQLIPVLLLPEQCIACALCEMACPVNAIEMREAFLPFSGS
ncbi:MAG: 4Fe-4S binding protein [Anaerolineaceae bacterium]|nr:4Fe-4S binding protein [Anaerolineaceae bacterium]